MLLGKDVLLDGPRLNERNVLKYCLDDARVVLKTGRRQLDDDLKLVLADAYLVAACSQRVCPLLIFKTFEQTVLALMPNHISQAGCGMCIVELGLVGNGEIKNEPADIFDGLDVHIRQNGRA